MGRRFIPKNYIRKAKIISLTSAFRCDACQRFKFSPAQRRQARNDKTYNEKLNLTDQQVAEQVVLGFSSRGVDNRRPIPSNFQGNHRPCRNNFIELNGLSACCFTLEDVLDCLNLNQATISRYHEHDVTVELDENPGMSWTFDSDLVERYLDDDVITRHINYHEITDDVAKFLQYSYIQHFFALFPKYNYVSDIKDCSSRPIRNFTECVPPRQQAYQHLQIEHVNGTDSSLRVRTQKIEFTLHE